MYNNEAGRLKPVWPNVGNKSCSIFTKVVLKEAIHVLLKNRPNSYKNWATFIKKPISFKLRLHCFKLLTTLFKKPFLIETVKGKINTIKLDEKIEQFLFWKIILNRSNTFDVYE